ncbi:MarR family winged helix-turn-helix transcriptional regulator [Pectinatus frisingensis]|uniref:MarR family winged helix-turn-helix transcriptional regulator n=1 Tax=Pectinatus frisingensis TaxID=865 RepID=UPI0015F39C22|nr:MarR family transcriptional regulator [Pectinatus frisingensis]
MNSKLIKNFLDACFTAKKMGSLMPPLPKDLRKPRLINIIDTVHTLSKQKKYIKISDISKSLKITAPSVTKLINELEQKNILQKHQQTDDKRVITVTLTTLGEKYYDIYINKYHQWLCTLFNDFVDEDILTTIRTINKAYKVMQNNRLNINDLL